LYFWKKDTALIIKGLNKVMLIGNSGKDPEMQVLEACVDLAKFTLATLESYKGDRGNPHTNTEWHNVVVWRSLAEVVGKYLKKGSSIYLEGKIKTRNYKDKEGMKKYVTEIITENLIMLDKPE